MDKKATSEQMEQLFAFTRQHYVEYYDLQCELADHLANAIEQRWIAEPDLDFNEALKSEFKKFGIFGFTTVVERREAALSKKYHKLLWGYFKEFFKLPKIILTLFLVFVMFNVAQYNATIYMVLLACLAVFTWYKQIAVYYSYKKKIKKTGRRWLLEDIIKRGGNAIALIYFPYLFGFNGFTEHPSTIGMIYMAVLFTAFALYQHIVLYVIPSKAEEHLLKTYPEYNL